MIKKGLLFVMSLVFLSILTGCGINKSDLVGDIVMSHGLSIYTDKTDICMVKYNFAKNEMQRMKEGIYYDLEFNGDKSKILCERFEKDGTKKSLAIYEYGISSKELVEIVNSNELNGQESEIKYVPNSNNISYVLNHAIYIYDITSKKSTPLIKEVGSGSYSWDKSGKKVLYDDINDKIHIYDVTTKENNQILTGRYPIFSNDNQYIAYQGENYKLTVFDVDTKEEWQSISLSGEEKYIFSPDDKYLALATQYSDITNNPHFEIYVVDYKTGKKIKLFKGDGGMPSFDWK